MADASKVLRAFLTKVFKMSTGDIDSILSESTKDEDAINDLSEADKARVVTLSTPPKGQTFQDGYKKGKKESREELEASIKDEYDLETEAQGIDLIKEVVSTKGTKQGPGELTEEAIRKHPVYLAQEKANKKALTEANAAWEAKLNAKEGEIKKGQTMNTVFKRAIEARNALNPVIPTNGKIASNLEKSFLSSIENGIEYTVNEDGTIVMSRDGKVMTDDHGNTLDFDTYIKGQSAEYYEFRVNNGGGNAGNGNPGPGNQVPGNQQQQTPGAYPANIVKPKTLDELVAITNNDTIPAADRRTVLTTWQTEHPGE